MCQGLPLFGPRARANGLPHVRACQISTVGQNTILTAPQERSTLASIREEELIAKLQSSAEPAPSAAPSVREVNHGVVVHVPNKAVARPLRTSNGLSLTELRGQVNLHAVAIAQRKQSQTPSRLSGSLGGGGGGGGNAKEAAAGTGLKLDVSSVESAGATTALDLTLAHDDADQLELSKKLATRVRLGFPTAVACLVPAYSIVWPGSL